MRIPCNSSTNTDVAWYLCPLWQVLLYSTLSFKMRMVGIWNEKVTVSTSYAEAILFNTTLSALLRGKSSGGQGLWCSNFCYNNDLVYIFFNAVFDMCEIFLLENFARRIVGGKGWGIWKHFFGNLPPNLKKQACSLCQFFDITHQNFILIFKNCSFICAPLPESRNFLPFLTPKSRKLIPFSNIPRNAQVCREADDCYLSYNFAGLPHFDNYMLPCLRRRHKHHRGRNYHATLAAGQMVDRRRLNISCCSALLLKHHVEIFSLEFRPCYDHLDIPIFQMSF